MFRAGIDSTWAWCMHETRDYDRGVSVNVWYVLRLKWTGVDLTRIDCEVCSWLYFFLFSIFIVFYWGT